MTLTGWGRTSRAEVAACRPERAPAAIRTLGTRYEHGILAYGKGRSYGDAPLNGGGNVLLTERLNRMVSFDPSDGTLVCEAGVTFDDLLTAFSAAASCRRPRRAPLSPPSEAPSPTISTARTMTAPGASATMSCGST